MFNRRLHDGQIRLPPTIPPSTAISLKERSKAQHLLIPSTKPASLGLYHKLPNDGGLQSCRIGISFSDRHILLLNPDTASSKRPAPNI